MPVKSIYALSRGLTVLNRLLKGDGLSLEQLYRDTAYPKATLLRILKTLEEAGWVHRRLADGAYLANPVSAMPASAHPAWTRLLDIATPHLVELQQLSPWRSDVAVRDGYVMRVLESSRALPLQGISNKVLGMHPNMLWTAVGRAYLAFCPAPEREEILAALRVSRLGKDRIARDEQWVTTMLDETRRQGYGLRDPRHVGQDLDDSNAPAIRALAVPIRCETGVAACLSCVWPAQAMTVDEIVDRYLGALVLAAERIGEGIRRYAERNLAGGHSTGV